jgi:hypothetical protein
MVQVKQRRRNRISSAVASVVLLVAGAIGVYVIRGGIVEHRNASALKDPDSDFVPVVGAVTSPPTAAGKLTSGSRQMSVRFTTADDRRVETRVWTRRDNDDFDKGQRIGLEYVTQRPTAARLPGNQGGAPELWSTLVFGVLILGGVLCTPSGCC